MTSKEKGRPEGSPIPNAVVYHDATESIALRSETQADFAQASRRDFILAQLRGTSLRVKLIDNEIAAIGTALKAGFITPDTALEWAEEMAPGCIGFIPDTVRSRQLAKAAE
jgi:hypothetical protein